MTKPVRFLIDGCSVNIDTMEKTPKEVNIIYQFVYWDLSEREARDIARRIGAKAVFSD